MRKQRNLPRKSKQIASRFDYYTQIINEEPALLANPQTQIKKKQMDLGPSHFHYFQAKRDNIRHFELVSCEMLLHIADKIYRKTQGTNKQEPKILKKDQPSIINEEIEFIITPNMHQQSHHENHSTISSLSVSRFGKSGSSTLNTNHNTEAQKYCLYISHTSKETPSEWVYFIQRLTIAHAIDKLGQKSAQLKYQAIIGLENQNSLINSIMKKIFFKKNQNIVSNYSLMFEEKVNVFESTLIKQLKALKIKNTHEQKMSHPQHRRQDSLPIEHYNKFQKLKVQVYRYYSQLNKHKKLNHYSIDNLICRFMKFKEYNYEQTLKGVINYLNWQKSMRQRYNLQSFNEYKHLNLYQIVGKDKQGRILLLFRPYNIFPDQITDEAKYVDYTLYMLDIFIEDNTQGYIDDFVLIADYEPFGSSNFKLSVAREVADKAKELFPDRQHRLICFGLNTFCYLIFRGIKPFLPSYVLEKAAIFGTDKEELKEFLAQHIDLDSLPAQILGEEQKKWESTSNTKMVKLQKN